MFLLFLIKFPHGIKVFFQKTSIFNGFRYLTKGSNPAVSVKKNGYKHSTPGLCPFFFFPPAFSCTIDFKTVTVAVISVSGWLQIHVLPDLARYTRNAHPEMAAEIARRQFRLVYYIMNKNSS